MIVKPAESLIVRIFTGLVEGLPRHRQSAAIVIEVLTVAFQRMGALIKILDFLVVPVLSIAEF